MKANQLYYRVKIAEEFGVKENRDIQQEIRNRVNFIKKTLRESRLTSLVLGVSGGVDSLTTALLCQQAVQELREDYLDSSYNFIAVKLPYNVQKDADIVDKVLNFVGPDYIELFNIMHPVNDVSILINPNWWSASGQDREVLRKSDFIKGNIKARMRMLVQYALAAKHNGLVVGTDHATEAVTGFFTKFGDGAFDFSPLSTLVKSQVRAIAKAYGAPEELYNKVATADLEELHENKPDDVQLGVSYEDIENFFFLKPISDEAYNIIMKWYNATNHKRALPVTY